MQSTKTLAQLKCSVPLKIGSGGLTAVNNNSATILMHRSTQELLRLNLHWRPLRGGSCKPGAQAKLRPSRRPNSVLLSELPFQYQLLLPSLTLEEPATARDVRVPRAYAPRFPQPPGPIPRRPRGPAGPPRGYTAPAW